LLATGVAERHEVGTEAPGCNLLRLRRPGCKQPRPPDLWAADFCNGLAIHHTTQTRAPSGERLLVCRRSPDGARGRGPGRTLHLPEPSQATVPSRKWVPANRGDLGGRGCLQPGSRSDTRFRRNRARSDLLRLRRPGCKQPRPPGLCAPRFFNGLAVHHTPRTRAPTGGRLPFF